MCTVGVFFYLKFWNKDAFKRRSDNLSVNFLLNATLAIFEVRNVFKPEKWPQNYHCPYVYIRPHNLQESPILFNWKWTRKLPKYLAYQISLSILVSSNIHLHLDIWPKCGTRQVASCPRNRFDRAFPSWEKCGSIPYYTSETALQYVWNALELLSSLWHLIKKSFTGPSQLAIGRRAKLQLFCRPLVSL